MRLLLGLCSRIANATGADQVPAVREKLGEMAAIEATIGGLVNGQINAFESWPEGYVCFNRRFMYAGLEWCTQNYSRFIDELRDALRRRRVPDAGGHLGAGRSGAGQAVRHLLADAAGGCASPA